MKNRYEELKKDVRKTLKGKTDEEKIQDINNRIVLILNANNSDEGTYRFINMLKEIKKELKEN